jgi:hypothetical protein
LGGGNMAAEPVYNLPEDEWDDTYADDKIWQPEDDIAEEPIVFEQAQRRLRKVPALKPSQFTQYAFYMPRVTTEVDEDGEKIERISIDKFSFEGRRHMIRCYDTPARRVLLFCGRQVEKSTLLGNITLCYVSLIPSYKALYVSPSATQTKTFSNDRIKEPIETSSVLKRFTTTMLSQNIFEKQFVNWSKLTLRYAYLNADRTRGIPAHLLEIDEFQDVLQDNVPVIEQCLSHAPKHLKRQLYSGTPKSLDNHLEYYRANLSTQGEWVVPCDAHGGETGRYWNVLGEKNIGKRGLVCEKCHRLIDPMHPDAQWMNMVKEAPWESYRIPQLMVPWVDWNHDILHNYEHYPREKFYNECLGLSYDSGLRPLTLRQLKDVCRDDIDMTELEKYRALGYAQHIYAGIDWGTGEHSYTVITLGTYIDMKFRVFFTHRFTGEEVDPEVQIERILELIRYFNVRYIGTDYGGGFDRNYKLIKEFGANRVRKFQYLARSTKGKVVWDGGLQRWKVSRTEVMSDIFNAIKRGKCEFPRFVQFLNPHGQDMLNIFSEYNEQLKMIQYKHGVDKPDDTFHSFLYLWLVSMFDYPRPDIISPDTEDAHGFRKQQWPGPVDQG